MFQSLKDLPDLRPTKVYGLAQFRDLHRTVLHDPLHDIVDEGDLLLVVERGVEELGERSAYGLLRETRERADGCAKRILRRAAAAREYRSYTLQKAAHNLRRRAYWKFR